MEQKAVVATDVDEEDVVDGKDVTGSKTKSKAKAKAKTAAAPRVKRAKSGHSSAVTKYCVCDEKSGLCTLVVKLPLDAPKVLVMEIAEVAAAETFVRLTPGIDKVFVLEGDKGGQPSIQVDGTNFMAAWEQDGVVDVNSITCNDVTSMLTIYGVEAARSTLLSEVRAVFGAYGIGVDYRHLSLIADFMTQGGGYRACNRLGIESCTSPLLKMSFETSAHFLQDAALRGASDSMASAAARIVMGQPVALGTGSVSLHMELQKPSIPVLSY